MNTTPPTVLFGKIDIEKITNSSIGFGYFKISEEIDIYTYPSSIHLQCQTDNISELNLNVQIFNCQDLIPTDNPSDYSRNVLLIFKNINNLLGENTSEILRLMLSTDATIHSKLSEMVSSHFNTLSAKNETGILRTLSLKIWVSQLMYDILDKISHRIYPNNLTKYKHDDIQKIRDLANSLKDNFQFTSPSLDEMAESVGMSPTKFKMIFKEVWNESPHQYILDLRLNHAKKLLKDKDLTISQIAYKVGFNHPSALTRLFKNKLGIAPNEVTKR